MSIFLARIKNWLIEKKGWIILFLLLITILMVSFSAGYFLGKNTNQHPIIINKNSANLK